MVCKKRLAGLLIGLILLFCAAAPPALAWGSTTYTYTTSVDGTWIRTQNAYMSGDIYLKDAGLSNPNDIFERNGRLYVADTGNGRVVVLDPESGRVVKTVGQGELIQPLGVFVTPEEEVYVADAGAGAVYAYGADGRRFLTIERPATQNFSSESVFQPSNVTVSSLGHIFVVGIGAYEGIMQFDKNGVFQGYFASNQSRMTLLDRIQDLFFSRTQTESMLTRKPQSIQNIDIADNDLIYAVTQSDEKAGGDNYNIKLSNLAGKNILARNKVIVSEANYVDVAAGKNQNFFAVTYTGVINEYDGAGNLLFSFGGRATTEDKAGIFTKAAALTTDEKGFVYVLDAERGLVQSFYPTEFTRDTHRALLEMENGRYQESKALWENLLRLNGMSRIAHIGYGKALMLQHDFQSAMAHFETAREKELYSQAMWEYRNAQLNRIVPVLLAAVLVLAAGGLVWKVVGRRRVKAPAGAPAVLSREDKTFGRDMRFALTMLRHPIDGFYYLKHGQRGSVLSASLLYLLEFLVFLFDQLFRGFLYNGADPVNTPPLSVILSFVLPVLLWIIMSYMISAISDGEASLRNIYTATAYALTPYLVLVPFVIAASYVLTLNEAFLIAFPWWTAVLWSGVLLILSIKETQNYTLKESIRTIVLTILLILLAVVTCVILYLMWNQLATFVQGVWEEAMYRVSG